MVGSWSATAPLLLAENPEISRSGTADRVVINDPPASISADEVYAFEGIIYDAVNNIVGGDISWSASNGTMSDEGLFYPWSAGLIEIVAEHNGLRDYHNITVEAGVPTSIDITRLSVSYTHLRAHET